MSFRYFSSPEKFLFEELRAFLNEYSTTQVYCDYVGKYMDQNGQALVLLSFKVWDRNDFEKQSDRVQFGEKMVSAIEKKFPRYQVTILKHFFNKNNQINYFVNIFVDGQPLIRSFGTGAAQLRRTAIPGVELEAGFKYIIGTVDENEHDFLMLDFDVDYKDKNSFMDPINRQQFGENLVSSMKDEFQFEVNVEHNFYNMNNRIQYYVRILVEGQPIDAEQLQDLVKPIRNFLQEMYPDQNDGTSINFLFAKLDPFLKQYSEQLAQPQVESRYVRKQIDENGHSSTVLEFIVLDSDFEKLTDRVQFGENMVSAIENEFPRYQVVILKHFYNKIDRIEYIVNISVDGEPLLDRPRIGPTTMLVPEATFKYTYATVDEEDNDLLMLEFDVFYKDKKSFMDPRIRKQFGRDLTSTFGKQFKVEVNSVHCFYNMKDIIKYYVRILVDGQAIIAEQQLVENTVKFLQEKYPRQTNNGSNLDL